LSKMSSKFFITGIVVLLLMVFGVAAAFGGGSTASAQDPAPNSLTVSGQGKISIKPDMAYITTGVNTEAKTARDAQTQNNQSMDKVIAAIKSQGIAEKDIKTVNYSLSPRYDYVQMKDGSGKQVLAGYTVYNQVQVNVRDINAVGKTLDAVVTAGANMAGGISFTLSEANMEKANADALTAALKNAQGKAKVLATGLGVSLGKPKQVIEGGATPPPVIYDQHSYATAKAEAALDVPVSTGQMEVNASISLVYEY